MNLKLHIWTSTRLSTRVDVGDVDCDEEEEGSVVCEEVAEDEA